MENQVDDLKWNLVFRVQWEDWRQDFPGFLELLENPQTRTLPEVLSRFLPDSGP